MVSGVMLWCLRGNVVVSGVMLWCQRGYVVVSEGLCCGVGGVMLWCRRGCVVVALAISQILSVLTPPISPNTTYQS